MNIIRSEFKQRQFDGKWQELGLIEDRDNAYPDDTGLIFIPVKWITLNVYDYLMEIK
jgi:hypothetical protein